MKLKTVLRKLSADSLAKILSFWEIPLPAPIDTQSETFLVDYMYPRLQQRPHFEAAIKKLGPEENNLVSFLAMHGGDLEKNEVLERIFKGNEDAMDTLVSELSAKGFVYYDKIVEEPASPLMVGLPEPYLRFIDLPAYWEGYLGFFLRHLTNQQVRHLAAHGLKINLDSTRKDYLLNEIRSRLLTPRTLRLHIDALPEDQRILFQMLVDCKGTCLYRDLLEMGFQKRSDHSKADHINTLLQQSGLVFTAVPGANKYSNLLMIPRDIYYIVTHHFQPDRRSLGELDTVSVIEKEKSPGIILDNSATLLRDIVIFAAQVNRLNVRPLSNGGIGKNDLKKILPKLSRHKALKYAQFLALFLIQKKFLVSAGDKFHISNLFMRWLEKSRTAFESMVNWWIDTIEWNEEYLEGNVSHADLPPGNLANLPEFRRLVIRHLVELPGERWCNFEGFAEALGPQVEAQIPRRGSATAFDRHNRGNDLIIESILAETLYWLGLVSVGLESVKEVELVGNRIGNGRTAPKSGRRGRPKKQKSARVVFRLTDLGRIILPQVAETPGAVSLTKWNAEETPEAARFIDCRAGDIIVQPNFEILAPPDLNLQKLYSLNEFSEIHSVDVMTTLHISRESVRSGMDHGLHAEDILKFLVEATHGRLPDAVKHLVTETSDMLEG